MQLGKEKEAGPLVLHYSRSFGSLPWLDVEAARESKGSRSSAGPPPPHRKRQSNDWSGGVRVEKRFFHIIRIYAFANLPLPLDAEQAGKRGFSETSALEHVKYLTGLGPHPPVTTLFPLMTSPH
ncbi:hypothetical protein GUJ93_ZPchr0009g443 [Zizania palustris]|uniref:Uncharacterized protein n=1 Tax=Zizania palustris TaxID=103762 RepID=A0A8J5R4Q0_ZIZPA|nr:hypothetical protein GUJ93_ZPchr0009g443 [Zizania palustris]